MADCACFPFLKPVTGDNFSIVSLGGTAASGSIPTESINQDPKTAEDLSVVEVTEAEAGGQVDEETHAYSPMHAAPLEAGPFPPHPPTPFPHDSGGGGDGLVTDEVPVNDDDVDHYDDASPIVDASAAMAAVAACESLAAVLHEAAEEVTRAIMVRDMHQAKEWRARRDALEDALAAKVQVVTTALVDLIARAHGAEADETSALDALLVRVHALA